MAKKATLITNNEMYDAARAYSATFAKSTSGYDAKKFFQYVKELSTAEARNLVNEFMQTALAFYLNKIAGTGAKNPLSSKGFGAKFYQDMAGLMQNMYVTVSDPVDPKFVNIQDGDGADPFRVKKPEVKELFNTFNSDYQNYITLSEVQVKTAFNKENGISLLANAVMKGFESKFTEWEYNHQKEVIGTIIQSVKGNENQVVDITKAGEDFTADELRDTVNSINNILDSMTIQATGSFNEGNWVDIQDKSDLKILVRPSFKNALKTHLLSSAFHKEDLNIDAELIEIPDFGNMIYMIDPEGNILPNNVAIPLRDEEGRVIPRIVNGVKVGIKLGTCLAPHTELTETQYGTVKLIDPYKDVIAVIADKDAVFEVDQNPYSVYGIYNPRNMCTTYWANKPNVGFHYDKQKNVVLVKVASTTIPTITANPYIVGDN